MLLVLWVRSYEFSRTAGKGGKRKTRRACGGLRKSVVLYLVRELRRRVATRLAEIIDQTTALQRAAFSARCGFGMAGFTNMSAESREVRRAVNGRLQRTHGVGRNQHSEE